MRHLIRCKGIRSLCYGLILALLATVAPVPLMTPASAQLMPTYNVGVVDFVNETGIQGEALARLATDAVVVEMSKTNRYDVNTTRTQMKAEMEKLSLHAPLDKLGLVRLGESLGTDAMLEGAIKSVQLAGSGATRRASVTLVTRMYDEASGELINGAVQTATSSARVGYNADDDALITEAINNAAFMAVKTMVDYVIPEATIQMNIGENQVMLNKGARDGIKSGMRMIVLRQKEIIGYIETRDVSPQDTIAKVTKSMRGIQPEDKVRAIFDMPAVGSPTVKSEPLPSGAPQGTGGGKGTASKIGKFLLGAAIVFGLVSLFKGGRGNEDAPTTHALNTEDGVPGITWDPSPFEHGRSVIETQVLRDGAQTVDFFNSPTTWDLGFLKFSNLFGNNGGNYTFSYHQLVANPSPDSGISTTANVPIEARGQTHTYQVRVLYREPIGVNGDGSSSGGTTNPDGTNNNSGTNTNVTYQYKYSTVGSPIIATAIDPVMTSDVIDQALRYDPNAAPPEVFISDLQQGNVTFQWNSKLGADIYKIRVEPNQPGTAATWESPSPIYAAGPTVTLPAAQQTALANILANTAPAGTVMKWRVYCRHAADSNQTWVKGEDNLFIVGQLPPSN